MPICGIVGCTNRPSSQKGISFHKIPTIIKGQGEETQKLSEERRRLWKAAINRKDITSEEKCDRTIVCSKHFVGGHSACTPESATSRYRRARQRGEKRKRADAITSLLNLKKSRPESDLKEREHPELQNISTSDGDSFFYAGEGIEQDIQHTASEVQGPTKLTKDIQTLLTINGIENIENDNKARLQESNSRVPFTRQDLYSFEGYEKDPNKVSFYTGLPNLGSLKLVFNLIEAQMSNS
ncbi:uncharacterized protein LOC106173183 isoform X2 [Lingula anatina]|uniref:Uncharacterized protein LOC106173183 isoform X2 n=1 Tax=Lingula anatina TaxID=7574 RepID=A0A1S3JH02_LINAN|nr:uncharacterized protein LOC106173183 isoform X2 [Lingula anatina]|eukprot:XP_013409677.1 uncharacterized protein LOC106173183 isoform X2 [Lingula anatina]